MGYDDRREILERLEALERRVGSGHGERHGDWRHDDRGRGCCGHHHHHHHHGDDFDEKRVIDTIVRLVGEHVGRMMDGQASSRQGDGGEKRIVDLIVGLVSEHVEEIVARELDRRFGRAAGGRPDDDRSPSAPPPAPGGAREPEQR